MAMGAGLAGMLGTAVATQDDPTYRNMWRACALVNVETATLFGSIRTRSSEPW